MGKRMVSLLNTITKLRRSRCVPERLLILLPNCLQWSECGQNLGDTVQNCRRCGQCQIVDILEMVEEYGCQVAVATGGRLALKLASDDEVDAIVAVACEKELQEGLKGVFPKPALGVVNLRPNGPCVDTEVDLEELRETIEWFTRGDTCREKTEKD
ncbi:MAG: DUF116 domain-containing protein [Planctomycetota bacterium]